MILAKGTPTDQQNRIESPEIQIYAQKNFGKDANTIQWGTNGAGTILLPHAKELSCTLLPYTIYINQLKMDQRPKINI